VQAQPGSASTLAAVSAAMADERSALLGQLEDALRRDERIVAAWIGGSLGRGEADDLSDMDIHLAVVDERWLISMPSGVPSSPSSGNHR
jgi:hypothetical protein